AIYLKARDSKGRVLKQCQANEALIEDAHMNVEFFCEAVKQNSFASKFTWEEPRASKTDRKQLEKDRQTLEAAAKTNRNFSGSSEANLALCRDILGAGFSESDLVQAYRARRLVLTAPTDEERLQWAELDEDQRKLRLMNATTPQLKEEIREG